MRAVIEVLQTEGRQDSHDVAIVGHVHVQRLMERELCFVVVESVIDACVAGRDQFALESGGKFKDVPDPLCAAYG